LQKKLCCAVQQIPFMDHEPHPCWFCRPQALLRAKALECISLVGMAVGRDRFRADAHEVMKFMQALQVRSHIHQFSVKHFSLPCVAKALDSSSMATASKCGHRHMHETA